MLDEESTIDDMILNLSMNPLAIQSLVIEALYYSDLYEICRSRKLDDTSGFGIYARHYDLPESFHLGDFFTLGNAVKALAELMERIK
jgi:hypothetical protein